MIISETDANWAADEFINYFKNYTCVEDYLRFVKKQVIEDFETDSGESRADLSQFLDEGSIGDDFFNSDINSLLPLISIQSIPSTFFFL